MRKVLSISILLIFVIQGHSQRKMGPISVAYFGNMAYQPGLKIGAHFDLKTMKADHEESDISKQLFISPQLAFYVQTEIQTGVVLNADFGFKRTRKNEFNYRAFSIGTAFLLQSQVTSLSINLNDGSKVATRDNRLWYLPTINAEFGTAISENMGWYNKLSFGQRFAIGKESTMVVFLELGLRMQLFSNK